MRLRLSLAVGGGLGTLAIGILFDTTGMLLLRYLTDYVGLAAGLAGLLIAVSKIYDALVRQPDSALLGISLAVGLLPAAMLAASCGLIRFYDLTEQRLIALRSAVDRPSLEGVALP